MLRMHAKSGPNLHNMVIPPFLEGRAEEEGHPSSCFDLFSTEIIYIGSP